ncbi:amino acid ABC transporter permease [Amycolatopsis minnesotensis]|uniref:Amino acid ABC transporter permease n=1 Tax=Amycolatopsis minnesotensis TaxID=337894 RepID=A0ABN2Q0T3_9PSEU
MSSSDFLFDVPGPRAKRRIRIATVASVLVGAALLVLALVQFGSHGQLAFGRWRPLGTWPIISYLLQGLGGTALAAALSTVLAGALGLLLAFARVSGPRPVAFLARAYMEVIRVLPGLLLIYVVLFALPPLGLEMSPLWMVVTAITVYRATQFGEIFRSGILSLDRGQGEAALALGMSKSGAMRHVIFPQALRRVTPSLVGQLAGIVKDTAFGYLVSYADLLFLGKTLSNYNHLLIQTYLVIALVYFLVNFGLSRLARWLEARERRSGRSAVLATDPDEDLVVPPVPGAEHEPEAELAAADAAEWELAEEVERLDEIPQRTKLDGR